MIQKVAPIYEEIILDGKILEEAHSFCYLASMVDKEGGTGAEVKARIGKAQTAMENIWKSRDISFPTNVNKLIVLL